MRKRKLIQKMCVLALTFAMLTAPISYAEGETFDERIEQEEVEAVLGQGGRTRRSSEAGGAGRNRDTGMVFAGKRLVLL